METCCGPVLMTWCFLRFGFICFFKGRSQLFCGYHIHWNPIFALGNYTIGSWQIFIQNIYDLKGSFSRGGLGPKRAEAVRCPLKILGSQTISLW